MGRTSLLGPESDTFISELGIFIFASVDLDAFKSILLCVTTTIHWNYFKFGG